MNPFQKLYLKMKKPFQKRAFYQAMLKRDYAAMEKAVKDDHLREDLDKVIHLRYWIAGSGKYIDVSYPVSYAVQEGDMTLLKWLGEHHAHFSLDSLEYERWKKDNYMTTRYYVQKPFETALKKGNLEAVEFIASKMEKTPVGTYCFYECFRHENAIELTGFCLKELGYPDAISGADSKKIYYIFCEGIYKTKNKEVKTYLKQKIAEFHEKFPITVLREIEKDRNRGHDFFVEKKSSFRSGEQQLRADIINKEKEIEDDKKWVAKAKENLKGIQKNLSKTTPLRHELAKRAWAERHTREAEQKRRVRC